MSGASERNVVVLQGGLGNQLFQVSFGRWLERRTGRRTGYDMSVVRGGFALGAEIPELAESVTDRVIRGSRAWPAIGGRLGGVAGAWRRALGPRRIVVDTSAAGEADTGPGAAWWRGYWQRREFAAELIGDLHAAIRPEHVTDRLTVQVRLGDYAGNRLALPPEWYLTAIPRAVERVAPREIVIYSDDARRARALLGGRVRAEFVQGRPRDALRGISSAGAAIVSRSTFGWWAGMLCAGHGGEVITSGGWNADAGDEQILPPTWVLV